MLSLYTQLSHNAATVVATVAVFTISLFQLGLWSRLVNFLRASIYMKMTSFKADTLLTEAFILEQEGMELEVHDIKTKDGYNLRLQRANYKNCTPGPKKVILLQHGLMETSSVFALHGDHSISFRLAKEGYDVWFGNNRTNYYGQLALDTTSDEKDLRLHEKIHEPEYWNYSIDELVKYDFPAMVNYIRDTTGVDKIDFIGASQGAGQAFGAVSEFPEMKNLFNSMILVAPAMFIKKNPTEFLLQVLMRVPMAWFGTREFMIIIAIFQLFIPLQYLKGIIGFGFMKLMGFIKRPLGDNGSTKVRARMFSWIPIGCTSVKNLDHWMQVLRTGGPLRKYNSTESYAFESTLMQWKDDAEQKGEHRPNIFVLLGESDCVIDNKVTQDVFARCYPSTEGTDNVPGTCKIYSGEDYGHIDFIWADKASTTHIYEKIQKFLLNH